MRVSALLLAYGGPTTISLYTCIKSLYGVAGPSWAGNMLRSEVKVNVGIE
jgi:hypothetical protein